MKVDISIIIVSWNTRDWLARCLISVKKHLDEALSYEVIVVDNNSSDGSAEMVSSQFPDVLLIESGCNLGFVGANNLAVKRAAGRYFLLLNSDTEMVGSGVQDIVKYLDANKTVGVAAGKLIHEDGEFQRPYSKFPGFLGAVSENTLRRVFSFRSPFQKYSKYARFDENEFHEVDWLTGAYLYISRDMLVDGKIFDDSIFMYWEDTLLCRRAWDSDYKVVYLPKAPVVHFRNKSADKAVSKTALYSFQGSVIYFQSIYGGKVAKRYRQSVRSLWWLFRIIFGLVPIDRFQKKSALFKFLLSEDGS